MRRKEVGITRASGKFSMDIPGNTAKEAESSFPLEVGERVTIKASYSPFSASVDFGLIAPDGLFYYVTYYYTENNRYYKTEYPTKDVSSNTVSTKFDSYKLNNLGDSWVWAKSGYLVMSVSQAVSGNKIFGAVRAGGAYGHSSKSSSRIDISVTINVLTGEITTDFSIAPSSSGTVTTYGKKQSIFYNDGSEHVEA